MAQSAVDLADGFVEVLFYLNSDDLSDYGQMNRYDRTFNISAYHGPDQPTNKSWNQLAKQAKGDILIVCGDDVEFKTQGWDTKLKEAAAKFPDGYCILSCNDGRGGSTSHPHPIYTRRMYEALGYVMAPAYLHWYGDSFAASLAQRLGRHIWLEDVLLEHQKPSDHGIVDSTHQRIRTNFFQSRDQFVAKTDFMQRVLDAEVAYIAGLIAKENS